MLPFSVPKRSKVPVLSSYHSTLLTLKPLILSLQYKSQKCTGEGEGYTEAAGCIRCWLVASQSGGCCCQWFIGSPFSHLWGVVIRYTSFPGSTPQLGIGAWAWGQAGDRSVRMRLHSPAGDRSVRMRLHSPAGDRSVRMRLHSQAGDRSMGMQLSWELEHGNEAPLPIWESEPGNEVKLGIEVWEWG